MKDREPPQSCKELNCEAAGMLCEAQGGRSKCRPPRNCSELDCGTDVCTVLNIPDIPIEFRCPFNEASDRCNFQMITKLEGGRILACRDPSLTLEPCSEVDCPDDKSCAGKLFPGQSSATVSVCIPKAQISSVSQISTCDTVPDGFCGENEACIDSQQGDYRGFSHCTQINCNDTIPCVEEEDVCYTSNPRLLEESGISQSCAPIGRVSLEEDGTCAAGRTSPCNAPTTCTEFRMNSVLIGTGCIPPFVLPPRDCSQLSCQVGEECVKDIINAQIIRAACVSSAFASRLLSALKEVNL